MKPVVLFALMIALTSFANRAGAATLSKDDVASFDRVLNSPTEDDFVERYKASSDLVKGMFKDPDVRAAMLAKGILLGDGWRLRQINNLSRVSETDAMNSITAVWNSHPEFVATCNALTPYDLMFKNFAANVKTWTKTTAGASSLRPQMIAAISACRDHATYNTDLRMQAEVIADENASHIVPAEGPGCVGVSFTQK